MTQFAALGTTAVVLAVDAPGASLAEAEVRRVVAEVDQACSRFRADSELTALNQAQGAPFACSAVLFEAVEVSLRAAAATDGLVVPTLGTLMRTIGYDRSFTDVDGDGPPVSVSVGAVPAWQAIATDTRRRTITLPRGVELDLGATAKAWCADRAARAATDAVGSGVLVSLGGDVACAGAPPEDGWSVAVGDDHAVALDAPGRTVSLRSGGLATSGVTVRRWARGGMQMHHVIDPRTGAPATIVWRTASVAAATCADANAAATSAIILGGAAAGWLEARRLPALLTALDGSVQTVAGWPSS